MPDANNKSHEQYQLIISTSAKRHIQLVTDMSLVQQCWRNNNYRQLHNDGLSSAKAKESNLLSDKRSNRVSPMEQNQSYIFDCIEDQTVSRKKRRNLDTTSRYTLKSFCYPKSIYLRYILQCIKATLQQQDGAHLSLNIVDLPKTTKIRVL